MRCNLHQAAAERVQGDPRDSGRVRIRRRGRYSLRRANIHRDLSTINRSIKSEAEEWMTRETEVWSDSLLLNRVMRRSLLDLHMLKTTIAGDEFYAAGVPWFSTLFGRDCIITSLQTMAFGLETAADTLRLLARYQGTEVSDWRDEEPGKIFMNCA